MKNRGTVLLVATCMLLLITAWALVPGPSLGAAPTPIAPVPLPVPQTAAPPSHASVHLSVPPGPSMSAPFAQGGFVPAPAAPMTATPPSAAAPVPLPGPLPLPLPVAAQTTAPSPVAAQTTAPPAWSPALPRAAVDPLAAWGRPAAPQIDPRRFTEAHWQGLEVIPNTPQVARALKLPPNVPGVIIDDVTLPADLQGFQAGDLVTHVGQVPTPDLMRFIEATARQRDQAQAGMIIVRDGTYQMGTLVALKGRMGTANGETPSMIPAGARMPHPYRGPCTNCHRIGNTGTLPVDQGDLIAQSPPVIRVGAVRPHQDRGPCTACHQVLR